MEVRKQVSFLDRGCGNHDPKLPQNANQVVRIPGPNFPQCHNNSALACSLTERICKLKEERAREYRDIMLQLTLTPHLKTIHIPRAMEKAPFLQHPGLTAGQKRYLYSIANIYSTDCSRRLMQKQYLSTLQQRAHLGYITHRECQKYTDHLLKLKPQRENKRAQRSSSFPASAKQPARSISLPRIGEGSQRLQSGVQPSNKTKRVRVSSVTQSQPTRDVATSTEEELVYLMSCASVEERAETTSRERGEEKYDKGKSKLRSQAAILSHRHFECQHL
uniref:Protein FAM216A n=1 Tax=Callorhinchus milii TaxID=7868 RepID=V9L373_CALMI